MLGLGGDPLALQTLPPGKLTSLEFNVIEENEPLSLFELGLQKQTRVAYTIASNKWFPICDHESGAASVVNTPWDTRNGRDCGLHEDEEEEEAERECCTPADLEKLSCTTTKHN